MKKFKQSDYRILPNSYGGFYIQEKVLGLFIPWISTMGWWMPAPYFSYWFADYYYSEEAALDALLQIKLSSDKVYGVEGHYKISEIFPESI